MPKQLINLIGILVSVAVLAIGVFLVALPLAAQSFATDAQTQQVNQTNRVYQEQVDALTKAKANKAQTDAAVADLRAQIPSAPQMDDVFALVAQAAQSTGVTITGVTVGKSAPFAVRTAASAAGTATSPAPAPSPSATAGGVVGDAQQTAGEANAQTNATNQASGATSSGSATASGNRSQVDISITVSASDLNQMTAFLDALRGGPRLLANTTTSVTEGGSAGGVEASITALTFVAAPAATGGAQ